MILEQAFIPFAAPAALLPPPPIPAAPAPIAPADEAAPEPPEASELPMVADATRFLSALADDPGVFSEQRAAAIWQELVLGAWALADSADVGASRVLMLGRSTRRRPRAALSARQRQVLAHVERGESSRSTAAALGVSEATVSEALGVGLRKLGFRSRSELVWQRRFGTVLAAPAALRAARFSTERGEIAVLVFARPLSTLGELLTPAEGAVVNASVEGQTHAEIARARGTSRHTVGKQLASARKKLGAMGQKALGSARDARLPAPSACLPASLVRRFSERALALRLLR